MTRKTTARGRKLARQTDWERHRHESVNPVKEAIIKNLVMADVQALRTQSGLQAFTGSNAANVCNTAGRLVYIVAHAARHHGLEETPEARILAGTAGALGDIAEHPAALETQRNAIIAGLEAIERLMPNLHPLSLATGALELDQLLQTGRGLGTSDVRKALGLAA
jgi:hypothetical protein